jgi:hypothetical protein
MILPLSFPYCAFNATSGGQGFTHRITIHHSLVEHDLPCPGKKAPDGRPTNQEVGRLLPTKAADHALAALAL